MWNEHDKTIDLIFDTDDTISNTNIAKIEALRCIAFEQHTANLIAYMNATGDIDLLPTIKERMGIVDKPRNVA